MIGYGEWYYLPASQGAATKTASQAYAMTLGERLEVSTSLAVGKQVVSAVNGTTLLTDSLTASADTGLDLYLFACNKDGASVWPSKARLYGLRIYQDGRLVRNFKPVRMKSGLAALWEATEKKAYFPKLVNQPTVTRSFSLFGPETGPVTSGLTIHVR